MRRATILLTMTALLLGGLALTGCRGEEKPKEPAETPAPPPSSETAPQPEPPPSIPPETPVPAPPPEPAARPEPPAPEPEPAPRPEPPAPEAEPAPLPVPEPAPQPEPAPEPEPSAAAPAGRQKTPWDQAKVGDTMVYRMTGGIEQTYKVTAMDENQATVQMTMVAGEITNSMQQKFDRVVTVEAAQPAAMPEGHKTEIRELGDETIKLADREFACKVTQTTVTSPEGTTVSKAWVCPDVPLGTVKMASGPPDGPMETVMELIEFTRGN